jgi:hypothetical protein
MSKLKALAKDAGIEITASNKLLGRQWEQFHDGVMGLVKRNAELQRKLDDEQKRARKLEGWERETRERNAELVVQLDEAAKFIEPIATTAEFGISRSGKASQWLRRFAALDDRRK